MASPSPERFASRRLADVLRAEIRGGTYPPGTRMPSYRQLKEAHHVALNTAQAAIRILAAEGLVDIQPGKGAYVRTDTDADESRDLQAELASLQATLRRSKQDLADAENAVASLLARHFTTEHAN